MKQAGWVKNVPGKRWSHVYQQNVLNNDHVTAHLCISADGSFIPTMIIFKGGMPHRNYKDGLPGRKHVLIGTIVICVNLSLLHGWKFSGIVQKFRILAMPGSHFCETYKSVEISGGGYRPTLASTRHIKQSYWSC